MIGQHFVGGFDGTTVPPLIKELIQKYDLGGIILFSHNIESPQQVKELTRELQSLSPIPLLIGIDQEGGPVARLKSPFTEIPPMEKVGEYYKKTKHIQTVKQIGRILGRELRAVGINWDFAPVVDVHSNPTNPIIGIRSFDPDPKIVVRCAGALIKGLHAEGVLSCAKHFPGHGATSADSHLELPILKDAGRLLWKRDVFPYRKLIAQEHLRSIMTAHVRYPAFDSQHCATLSKKILTDMLRGRLKYKGLIVSDDFFMKAIADRIKIADACLQFFYAGGDIALVCKEPEIQKEAIQMIINKIQNDDLLKKHFSLSSQRIKRIKKRFCQMLPSPSMEVIGCEEHQKIVKKLGASNHD